MKILVILQLIFFMPYLNTRILIKILQDYKEAK